MTETSLPSYRGFSVLKFLLESDPKKGGPEQPVHVGDKVWHTHRECSGEVRKIFISSADEQYFHIEPLVPYHCSYFVNSEEAWKEAKREQFRNSIETNVNEIKRLTAHQQVLVAELNMI
jgi:hypothetical protein